MVMEDAGQPGAECSQDRVRFKSTKNSVVSQLKQNVRRLNVIETGVNDASHVKNTALD